MRDGRGGFAATDSMTGTNGGGFCRGIRTQNLEKMEIRPAVARARSTGSALDRECLSLFQGFKATAAISGDPEPSFRKIHRDCRTWRLVCSLSSAPLRGLARPKLPTPGF